MTDTQIKYLTEEDMPNIVTPCYITEQGEVYQFNKTKKKLVKKKTYYDNKSKAVKISFSCNNSKHTTALLATTVYRYFSNDDNLPINIHLNFKDGDIFNCCIDNLERIKALPKRQKKSQKSAKLTENAKNPKKKTLTLTDFCTFLSLFQLMKRHKPLEITPNEVILDTKYLSPEELNRLKNMKLDERVKII